MQFQYSKIIQNPSHSELQKAANQGRRCTWEKLSAIKANCGIELALDDCVAILNHMRRLKRSAERAAAASQGLSSSTARFSGSKRIPSWNCIARENSTGSIDEFVAEVGSSLHQGGIGGTGPTSWNLRTNLNTHESSDSEPESPDQNSWTRSGGPLMRTTSADLFVDFVQNLDGDLKSNKGIMVPNRTIHISARDSNPQSPRMTTPDRSSDVDSDQSSVNNRAPGNSSSILVAEGELLQAERIHNGIVFNIVKKEDTTPSNRSLDSDSVAECMQLESPAKEIDGSSTSESEDETNSHCLNIMDASDIKEQSSAANDIKDVEHN